MQDTLEDSIYKDQIGFMLGTQLGTILYVPINFTALIYGFRYIGEIGGNPGTVVAEIKTQNLGTITGTIDVVSVQPGGYSPRDSVSGHAIARGNAGEYIVGAVAQPTNNTGSIEGVMTYAFVPGRISSD